MSMINNDLGLEEAEAGCTPVNRDSPVQYLPTAWYSSQDMYELERRAIFSQKWLLTTHKLRFPNIGDWVRFEIAGYAFIVVKDREGNVNAFHNVCRHRAFPVVTEEGGTSKIFSCQYHGWSYGLNGKLAKAPGYQELEGFDKTKNGLLPIHVHVDVNDFIWVNLDSGEQPETLWEDDLSGIDLKPRFGGSNFEDYSFDHTWEMTGEYNWKVLADDYNERYHPTSPSRSEAMDFEDNSIVQNENSPTNQIANDLKSASTYYFPNTLTTASPHCFFMQRFVPMSPTTCSMRCEIFRKKSSSDNEFEIANQTYKRIMLQNNDLRMEIQKNIHMGLSTKSQPDPRRENKSVYFPTVVRDLIMRHHKREENSGEELWPARQRLPQDAEVSKEDMDFCSKLKSKDGLALTSETGGCCGGGCGGGPPTVPATAPETMVR